MWQWWIFTFICNCVWIFWFIAKNVKNPKDSRNEFQWTIKHFFGKIIFCTCDLHLKLNILNPLNIIFLSKWFFKWVFCLVTLSFKISRLWHFCMIWIFIKFIQWTCTSIEKDIFLLYKSLKLIVWLLCIPFDSFLKKNNLDTWYS
jgi:hypothetical protein